MIHFNKKFQELIIVKSGLTETFQNDFGNTISLGDVLRSTVLLRESDSFERIRWFTSAEARSLIPALKNLTVEILTNDMVLDFSEIENALVVNLERIDRQTDRILISDSSCLVGWKKTDLGIWQLSDLPARARSKSGPLRWGEKLLALINSDMQETTGLFSMADVEKKYDVGLNWKVGSKWPSKQVPFETWKKIDSLLSAEYKTDWQQGHDNLTDYVRWIASCRMIVSTDSLGLHLALCMGIPTVGLFGATDLAEVDYHALTSFIEFSSPCLRCAKPTCDQKRHCSEFLEIEQVRKAIRNFALYI